MLAKNFQKLKETIRSFSQHRFAAVFLFFYCVLQSLIIPIPADMMLVPMALGNRKKAFFFAIVAALGSTIGGLIGYGIGYLAFHTIAEPVFNWLCQYLPNSCPEIIFPWLQKMFAQYGMLVVAVSSIAPLISFRFTSLAAGLGHMAIWPFVLVAFTVHLVRYGLVSWLVLRYGRTALDFIRKRVSVVALILFVIALALYFILA